MFRLSSNSSLIFLFGLRPLLQRWSSSKVIFGIMKRPCPTFVQIWQSEHPDDIFVMSANAGQTMGLGMDIENVDYRNLAPTYLPFHPLVELGLDKFIDAVNKLYVELNSHCPLKLWKDRLVAVWGEETK